MNAEETSDRSMEAGGAEILAASRWPRGDASASRQPITFVHVNDLHGAYTPDGDGTSPLARMRGFYLSALAENPWTVFTNGGDDFEKGSVIELASEGRANVALTHAMGFDVRCVGNHDFAWSIETLCDHVRDPRALTVLSNVEWSGEPAGAWAAVPFGVHQVGAVRVGFFGMVSNPWDERNEQIGGSFYDELPLDAGVLARAAELVAAHRDEVDLLVMVSHLGLALDRAIAASVDGIDVILGAHSHSVMAVEEVVDGCIIVQAGVSAAWIARLDLVFDRDTGTIADVAYALTANTPDTVPADPAMQAIVEATFEQYAPWAIEPVAHTRTNPCQDGTADVLGRAIAALEGVDGSLVDRDLLWTPIPRGAVTPQDLLDAWKVERQPAGTPGYTGIYTAKITGAVARRLTDLGPRWLWTGPTRFDDGDELTIAVQKQAAWNPAHYLGAGVTFDDVTFVAEAWDLVTQYARRCTAEGRCLDDAAPPVTK